ncbi:hypothetical protein, partial [Acinetobacter baumannii]|uniref:hypothetical protein n=1 Tax=Acinetobacter baumannii TaxID=470 RepID=UPI00286EFFC7
ASASPHACTGQACPAAAETVSYRSAIAAHHQALGCSPAKKWHFDDRVVAEPSPISAAKLLSGTELGVPQSSSHDPEQLTTAPKLASQSR